MIHRYTSDPLLFFMFVEKGEGRSQIECQLSFSFLINSLQFSRIAVAHVLDFFNGNMSNPVVLTMLFFDSGCSV